MSVLVMAAAMSLLRSVLRLLSCACTHARVVSSKINISHAFANNTGASLEIMRTSSSLFMIFLMRANGSKCVLKSLVACISSICSRQNFLNRAF